MKLSNTLREHIKSHFNGSQRAFADAQNVKPQQITQWLEKDFIVVGDILYSKRRDLEK